MGTDRRTGSKRVAPVTAGRHLTQRPGPRVLIEYPGQFYTTSEGGGHHLTSIFDASALAERLSATVPTVAVATSLQPYNLNEWDCIVTTIAPVSLEKTEYRKHFDAEPEHRFSWSQRYPDHMSVVYIVGSGDVRVIDAFPPTGKETPHLPAVAIIRDADAVGLHIRHVEGLPEGLATTVKNELVPRALQRSRHPWFRRWLDGDSDDPHPDAFPLRPFILGPDDVILAGSYERSPEASVWLVPDDLPDPYLWVVEALREWHELYPHQFPLMPEWTSANEWHSTDETTISQQRQVRITQFEQELEAYETDLAKLDESAAAARIRASRYERALLTDDGDSLAEAVASALAQLGFHVVDMDQHWAAGDRREDLRVFDDDDPDWVAIVEVKGAKNGAKETEVQNFGRWAERFILDERRLPDARWFVTNHQRGIDPNARQAPFANKPAVITMFAKSGGKVIDTRALFDLIQTVNSSPELCPAAKRLLKGQGALLVRCTASDLASDGQAPGSGT